MRTAGTHCVLRYVFKIYHTEKDYIKHGKFYRETGDFLVAEIVDDVNESA